MVNTVEAEPHTEMSEILARQRAAFLREGEPSAKTRIDRLARAAAMVAKHERDIVDAVYSDFGARSPTLTRIADVSFVIGNFRYARRHVRAWMKPKRREVNLPFNLAGARAWIQYQPLGVVGILSPWNFPFVLTFSPLADVLAAGNRAMIKPSELSPASSELITQMISETFDEAEVASVTGGPEVGAAFSRLPFDHLVFTGSTKVGRLVALAAAENLVPVTLELGGKSPCIIGTQVELKVAARRVAVAKTSNAGQICMAPDYAFVPERQVEPFVEAFEASIGSIYPTLKNNPEYTAVINEQHFERLRAHLEDARDKGARLIEINPAGEDLSDQRAHKIPPTLILDPTDEMTVMQEEIFGPLLPVKSYRHINEVIDSINDRPRPLALYYFGDDRAERREILARTTSGGVTLDESMIHYNIGDLPFGGVGASGTRAYRGIHGFRNFSHAKAVCQLPARDGPNPAAPPFGMMTELMMRLLRR